MAQNVLTHLHLGDPRRELTVLRLGIRELMAPCIVDVPSGASQFLIMRFDHRVIMDTQEYSGTLAPGTLVVWKPHAPHQYGNNKICWRHSWIECGGPPVQRWLRENHVDCNTPITFPDTGLFDGAIESVYREVTSHLSPNRAILRNLIENMIIEIGRARAAKHQSPLIPETYRTLRLFIEQHYADPLGLRDLAQKVHHSVPHFCRLFKDYFSLPPMEFLTRVRMLQAAYLLRDHNLRIADIALQVGYKDPYYFTRAFGKYYGVSPRAMRKSLHSVPSRKRALGEDGGV